MNITIAIRDIARTQPESGAIIRANNAAISYRTLDRLIDRIARRVLALGVSPGQAVGSAIAGPNEALALMLARALARIGVASADLDLPTRYLAATFVQPGAKQPQDTRCITFDESWLVNEVVTDGSAAGAALVPIHSCAAAIFRVLSTSGTTGCSRFCPVSHAMMGARIATSGFHVVGTTWPTILICAVGVGGAWRMRTALKTLSIGGTLVFTNRAGLAGAVLRHGVTSLTISTNTLQAVLGTIPPDIGPLPRLRAVLTGGSPVPATLMQTTTERLCANMMICYGSTEAATIAIGARNALAGVPFGVGIAEPSVEMQAVDADHSPCRPAPMACSGSARAVPSRDISTIRLQHMTHSAMGGSTRVTLAGSHRGACWS